MRGNKRLINWTEFAERVGLGVGVIPSSMGYPTMVLTIDWFVFWVPGSTPTWPSTPSQSIQLLKRMHSFLQEALKKGKGDFPYYAPGLKGRYTIGNCQRPVFSLGVSQHKHKITSLWKFELNWSSQLRENDESKNTLIDKRLLARRLLLF